MLQGIIGAYHDRRPHDAGLGLSSESMRTIGPSLGSAFGIDNLPCKFVLFNQQCLEIRSLGDLAHQRIDMWFFPS